MSSEKTYPIHLSLQEALFQVAKVGNINSMKQFIEAGADPYLLDEDGHHAVYYATRAAPEAIDALAHILQKIISQREGSKGE